MYTNILEELSKSLKTGFLDFTKESIEEYRPKLLVNNYKKGTKILNYIINELDSCEEFYFSVAFVTNSGINLLLNILGELEDKGIKGKIITTNYLNFNEPSALRRLLKFKNLEVKIFDNGNFHSKGYIFKNKDYYSLIVGSANLTQEALTKNEEWNLKLTTLESGELINNTLVEFNELWDKSDFLTNEWIDSYEKIYKNSKVLSLQNIKDVFFSNEKLKPNKMQKEALMNLQMLRDEHKNKALIISATGTGKTYLSAFDVKKYNPKKMLFVVHREQIAREAMNSFKNVFGDSKSMGILSGDNHDTSKDFIFATIQTLSKDYILDSIPNDLFDYIIIDEVHRAGASSYNKVLDHFSPNFLLGMTATPERTDGVNIYNIFDYNIAYEIRLQQALEEDMLCPFHYFGVSEISVEGEVLDDNSSFKNLTSSDRVDNIIKQIKFYGSSGERTKGLIFCSRNDEALELSNIFNNRGYRTIALSGANSQSEREDAVDRLESDVRNDYLDYIFTVDIFNEGVDIPSINQIVMLRPTESAIIFVQQLGRGLRKKKYKDYVVILDFIGNYQKNFLIPIALSGDRTYNKDNIRRYISEGTSIIPGCSTVMFDKISKERIFNSINNTSFSTLKLIKEEYNNLKIKLGRIPNLMDFYMHSSIDPQLIIDYADSYYNLLNKIEPEFKIKLNDIQKSMIDFVSREISNAKRPHELLILHELLDSNYISIDRMNDLLESYSLFNDEGSIYSALSILNNGFINNSVKYNYVSFVKIENDIIKKSAMLNDNMTDEFKDMLKDLLNYGLENYSQKYFDHYLNTNFTLYEKYTRKDVCRLLNWKNNEESTIYGYRIKYNTCPIFVTYKKSSNISESVKYEDKFINRNIFSWMTRNKLTLTSDEVLNIKNYKQNGLSIHLFVKRDDDEGKSFYYLGKVEPIEFNQSTIRDKDGKSLPIVNIEYKMETPVKESLYKYLTN